MSGIDWSQIGNAPIFERGTYFNPGRYKLKLLRVLSKQTQKSGTAFIAEFEVLESDNPAHQIGSKGTYFVKMTQQQQAFSNILELMAAILGFDIANPEHVAQINSQIRPQLPNIMVALETQGVSVLRGRETVSVECRLRPTQRGTEFTLHTWAPWTPPAGWTPAPTPGVASMPQRTAPVPQAAAPGGYPPAVSPQGYPPAFAPPAVSPQGYPQAPPAFAPPALPGAQAPVAPQGYPQAPAPGAPPPWAAPR